jgi:hypothetical protein
VYLITFAALAVQLLAITNAITMICSQHIHGDDDGEFEKERRERRKSGIRLDDMTSDTTTTLGSFNQYGTQQHDEHKMGYKIDATQQPQNQYDMYRQSSNNNPSHSYNQYHY